jgi:hypothetical protein
VQLQLTRDQAGELENLLDAYLPELSHEITATDNPEFRASLRTRRARLSEVAEALELLIRGTPTEPDGRSSS